MATLVLTTTEWPGVARDKQSGQIEYTQSFVYQLVRAGLPSFDCDDIRECSSTSIQLTVILVFFLDMLTSSYAAPAEMLHEHRHDSNLSTGRA